MFQHSIYLIGGADEETAIVTADERDELCHVTLEHHGRSISANADDFFEALARVRIQLESDHLIPFCYGASLNVFPSGMTRSMGSGLKAYRLTMGSQALAKDLVSIFDSGPDIIPASVARQKEYFNDWIASLKA
jgi:hypothetical protein